MLRFEEKVFSRDTLGDFCNLDCRLTGRGEEPMLDVGWMEVGEKPKKARRIM